MISQLVQLATKGLEYYLQTGKYLPETEVLTEQHKGVFVSIKKNGQNRGCMGTLVPTTSSMYEEVLCNTVRAAVHDARFFAVTLDELSQLTITVDVIGDEEPVNNVSALDPAVWGVHITGDKKSAIMLPNVANIVTVEQQLTKARQKAKIGASDKIIIKRFKTIRYY